MKFSFSWTISAIFFCLAVLTAQVCAFKSSLSMSSSPRHIFLFSSKGPKESDAIASADTNNVSANDPITGILPQLYTYQKPRQKRRQQSTRTRKPRFFWHDEQNIEKEIISCWEELNVPIQKYYPDQPPPIPSEFLLNHFNRNDLRWGIAQFGGRENLSIVCLSIFLLAPVESQCGWLRTSE